MFEDAIIKGTWTGIIMGLFNAGIPVVQIEKIGEVYAKIGRPYLPKDARERGICKGLSKIGLIQKHGFLGRRYIRVPDQAKDR